MALSSAELPEVLERISGEESTADVEKPIIIQSADGNSKVFVHDDQDALPILLEKGHGFDELTNEQCTYIEFEHDFRIHKDSIEAATHSGCTLQSAVPMVVYHAHVWWNYAYKLTLHGEKPDMQFSFLLLSLGPRAVVNEPLPKGALKDNTLSRQTPPMARNVQLRIGFKNDNEFVPINEVPLKTMPRREGYYVKNAIADSHLKDLVKENKILIFRITLQIERGYFDIEELADMNGSIVVEERNKKTLESVLAGKKCSNSDFIFTRGDSSANDATEYYVHKAPLAYTSITLHSIFNEKVSLPTDQILVESAQDRIIFPYLSDNDMRFLLTYLYTERVTLPEFNRFARVGRVISFLFDRVRLLSIFAQWQQLIIDGLLQIKENEKKVEYAMKSLIAVYSAPYGALPVAKRVAMSTLADQLMRQGDELVEKIKENEEFKKYSIEPILQSALKLKRLVAAVKKTSCD
ncbi:hypothetical protein Tcan_10111 [Toxocara canis]|uniref:BTB domain-containing protein n=1 Tax=Toxocara canis TaxID=6265 RepID=A0A0B2VP22_TOXCA|nr:hypothetical protein Tcan_10111 [Toxocara canis]